MSKGLAALTQRRLLIVTGKGGTGKTTLAAALGLLAAREGIITVVIEVGETDVLPRLLARKPKKLKWGAGRTPLRIAPHLFTLRIVPEVALTEYLELQLHVRRIVRLIVGNQGFRRMLDAAPGWRALITLGKLWHLQSQTERNEPRWPLLIVDGPSTGHGLSFLSVPNVVLDTVRLGPLRRHTDWVQALLKDASRTLVLPVALPEELPVSETVELCARVRELGMTLGPVIANAVEPPADLPDLDATLAEVARLPAADSTLLDPELLRKCVEHRLRRTALQRVFLEKLEQETGQPVIPLPYLARAIDGPESLAALADHLAAGLASWEPES
jgi:anion-transporting  ArsA/GET3 family ATPase